MIDLLLVHPPSYYYFREEKRVYGPIADVVPSSPVFDMYPYGFFSITYYLLKKGYKARIHNAAALMVLDESYRFEDYLRGIDAKLYGVDLHWLPHAHGALEVAKILKKIKGEVPVVFGGLSASIFWAEILTKYDFVDYVLVGDTTEKSIEKLIMYIEGKGRLEDIEGLAYRKEGRVKLNPPRKPEPLLNEYKIDFNYLYKYALTDDPLSFTPFSSFMNNPIGAVLVFKGCLYSCATCGGGRNIYMEYLGRDRVSFKTPDVVADEILSINSWSRIPVFVIGDLQLVGGEKYAEALVKELRENGFDAPIYFEFFYPPPLGLLEKIIKASHTVYLQLSPETQDELLRIKFGRHFNNTLLEKFIERAHKLGFSRIDLYFMHGIPFQTMDVALKLPRYVENLYDQYKNSRIDVFVSPLAPFIDPGSPAFKYPFLYGYKLKAKTLSEHVDLISRSRTWVEMLNYESYYMSNTELAIATAKTGLELLKIKARYGIIDEDIAKKQIEVIENYLESQGETISIDKKIIVPFEELYETLDLGKLLRDPDEISKILINITRFGENN
jgi:B12-binding domain/radical SAM domain protein